MHKHMLIFGMGYTASRFAERLRASGWEVTATRRMSDGEAVAFDDMVAVRSALETATHILSSVPPMGEGGDPVLTKYGAAITEMQVPWIGYLSSTGVYGDCGGAWVDESATVGLGRRSARADADLEWQKLSHAVRIFRLPGIYGPGRSALERVEQGKAHRIDLPKQIFSRVHVDDIGDALFAGLNGPAGIYNIADDQPASQNDVIEHACDLLGLEWPPLMPLDAAGLSPMARGFYAENRRVSNKRAKRLLQWQPQHPTYKQGLAAIFRARNASEE